MIQYQLKLKLNKKQEGTLNQWLWHLASVRFGVRCHAA
jgi:hypothetical protein